MYHSIFFEDKYGNTRNTYDDFYLVSQSRPIVKPPAVKTSYVEVPGADGSLDYTEALNGLNYQNRKGSWEFYVLNDQYPDSVKNWSELYTAVLKYFHGQKFTRIYLEDDLDEKGNPIYYYVGRISVNEWKSDPHYSKVTLDYDLDARKYAVPKSSKDEWKWDDLFTSETVNPIQYGKFVVNETKMRNIINGTEAVINATVWCQTAMKAIKYENGEQVSPQIDFTAGNNSLDLSPGDNIYKFVGLGTVKVYYNGGGKYL